MSRDPLCAARGHRSFAALRRDVSADMHRYYSLWGLSRPLGRWRKLDLLFYPPIACALLHRLAHWLHARGHRRAARVCAWWNVLVFKTRISPESCIGGGAYFPHPPGLVFHGRAGCNVTLYAHATVAPRGLSGPATLENAPVLGDGVSIGAHGAILGPVRVGDGARVAFRVVLLEDAPPGAVVTSRTLRTVERPAATP